LDELLAYGFPILDEDSMINILMSILSSNEGRVSILGSKDTLTFEESYSSLIKEEFIKKDVSLILESGFSSSVFLASKSNKEKNKGKRQQNQQKTYSLKEISKGKKKTKVK